MTNNISRKRELLILVVIMIVAVALRLAFLHEVLERDEGWYATIAQEILRGGIPYRDAIEQKPPGVFYLYAAAIALFGASVEALRIFTTIYALVTLISVYWLTRHLAGQLAGLFSAAIFAIYSPAPLLQGSSSNCEVFLVLPLVLSVIFFVHARDHGDRRLLAVSGLMAGIAILIKPVALPYMVLLLIFTVFFVPGRRVWQRDSKNMAIFLLPSIALALVTILYFYLNGALHQFLFWTVKVPYIYVRNTTDIKSIDLSGLVRFASHELLLPLLLSSVTASVLLLRKSTPNLRLVALLLPVAIVATLMPGRSFPHYFIQLFPFMAILGGIGLAMLLHAKRTLLLCATPLVLLLFGVYLRKDYPLFVTLPVDSVSRYKYGEDGTNFVTSAKIADYIKARTLPDDYIFQWGLEPELYFLAGRRAPVPYIASTIMDLQEDKDRAVKQLIDALAGKRPRYIVYQPYWADCTGRTELGKLIKRNYYLETTIGYGLIFRAK